MRSLLLVLIAAAAGCASTTPAPQAPATPPPSVEPTPAPVSEPLSEPTLTAFVSAHFADAVASGIVELSYGSGNVAGEMIDELAAMSITDTNGLAAIIPGDFATRGIDAIRAVGQTTNIAGLIRDLMIIHDVRGYFTRAWNNGWVANGPEDFPAPAAYGVDFSVMVELGVYGGGGYGGDGYGGGGLDDVDGLMD